MAHLYSKILDSPRSKFFQFHAVFGKFWQNRMLAPHWRISAPTSGKSWIRHWIWRFNHHYQNQYCMTGYVGVIYLQKHPYFPADKEENTKNEVEIKFPYGKYLLLSTTFDISLVSTQVVWERLSVMLSMTWGLMLSKSHRIWYFGRLPPEYPPSRIGTSGLCVVNWSHSSLLFNSCIRMF